MAGLASFTREGMFCRNSAVLRFRTEGCHGQGGGTVLRPAGCMVSSFGAGAKVGAIQRSSLCSWHMESPFDFKDIVIVKPVDLDDGSRRIRTIAPKFLLHLISQWTISVHVRRVDHDPQAILQRGSLTFSDMLHIEEGLPDACLGAVNQFVGRRIDAAYTRDIKRVRRLIERCQTPSTSWLNGARRRNWQHRR